MDYTGYTKYTKYRKFTNQWNWFVPCTPGYSALSRLVFRLGSKFYMEYIALAEMGFAFSAHAQLDQSGKAVLGLSHEAGARYLAAKIWSKIPFSSRSTLCLNRWRKEDAVQFFLESFHLYQGTVQPTRNRNGELCLERHVTGVGGTRLSIVNVKGEKAVASVHLKTAERLAELLRGWYASPYRLLDDTDKIELVMGDPSMLGTDGGYADFSPLHIANPDEFYLSG